MTETDRPFSTMQKKSLDFIFILVPSISYRKAVLVGYNARLEKAILYL